MDDAMMLTQRLKSVAGLGIQAWTWPFMGVQVMACVGLGFAASHTLGWTRISIVFALALMLITLTLSMFLGLKSFAELEGRIAMAEASRAAQKQVEELFAMTDMLQAAEDHVDAGAVLMATAQRLVPQFGGALYVFNNSRDRLDLAKSWNTSESFDPSEALLPGNCWSLKRGKPHINDPATATLCCMHHIGTAATIEVPMLARGQVHGLIVLALESGRDSQELAAVSRLAGAMADSMSLALSNISLREKLRTQSLRDPLTGLYNRRYMEDALERYVSLAERNGAATTVLMMDLDNFKRLNDEFGHAMGDTVLRDVAAQLIGGLRPSDVVCRYGGEELLVILPDCGMADAQIKAEALRLRVQGLTEIHGAPISVSIGIASIPETSTSVIDLVAMADAALYEAKLGGKNRIVVAEKRGGPGRDDPTRGMGPRLAASG